MKLSELITKKRAKVEELRTPVATKLAERQTHADAIAAVRTTCDKEDRDPTEAETTQIREARAKIKKIDDETAAERAAIAAAETEISELEDEERADAAVNAAAGRGNPTGDRAPGYDKQTRIGTEERTYSAEKSRRGQASFFADAWGARSGHPAAIERTQRNLREAEVEGEISERAMTTGSFSGLVVPQYLVELFAPIARAGRPFADVLNHLQLPEQGMVLMVPRGTAGAVAGVQATQNTAVAEGDTAVTDLPVPVVTIAGQQKTSRQSLERGTPGMDELLYADLVAAHAVQLDQQVLAGSGASGQMRGVLNTAGIIQMSPFGAAATAQSYYSKVAGAIAGITTQRLMAPTLIASAPRRWSWLTSLFDNAGRPLMPPRDAGPMNALGDWLEPKDAPDVTPAGQLQGLPNITDANVPLSVGTGPEDQTIVTRREDLLLWEEGNGLPRQLTFEQPAGNQLQTILVVYSYAAFTAERYPQATAIVGGNAAAAGNGTIAPTF